MTAPLPTPYYDEDGITLYHGDCRDLLAGLRVDVLVTDPPYGIGWKRSANAARMSKASEGIANDADTSARDYVLDAFMDTPALVFGSFYAPFPARLRQVLVWQKAADAGLVGSTTGLRRDVEPVFVCGPWTVRTAWRSSLFSTVQGNRADCEQTGHPHHKPVSLMTWLLEAAPPGAVLDPFAGSGSTLVAAKQLGRQAIGIEIDEQFCEVAAKRLAQGVLAI